MSIEDYQSPQTSLVTMKSDLSKFRRKVVKPSSDPNPTGNNNTVEFGKYQPISQQYLSQRPSPKPFSNESRLAGFNRPEIAKSGVSKASALENEGYTPTPFESTVSLEDVESRYAEIRRGGKKSGNFDDLYRQEPVDLRRNSDVTDTFVNITNTSEPGGRFTESNITLSDPKETVLREDIQAKTVSNNSRLSGRFTISNVEVNNTNLESQLEVSDVLVLRSDLESKLTVSNIEPVRSNLDSRLTVSNVVVDDSGRTDGRFVISPIDVVETAKEFPRTPMDVASTSEPGGRYESNTDVPVVETNPSGRHDDGNIASVFNIDGTPVGGTIGGRYDAFVKSEFNFQGSAPAVNYISDANAGGFVINKQKFETDYNVRSSAYGLGDNRFGQVNFFEDAVARGFVTNAVLGQTLYTPDSSKYVWKGNNIPTTNNMNDVHGTGFTLFAPPLITEFVIGSSRHGWVGFAPSVDYLVNVHVSEGFHVRAQKFDSKYIFGSSLYDWEGVREDAPATDYFYNYHTSGGFTTFARKFDSKYVPEISIYDWDGARADAPATDYFINRHVTTGFHTFAQLFDTKYIHGSSDKDWDGARDEAPEVNFFINRHTTAGFHKFAAIHDTKYIPEVSVHDWDGTRDEAPSVNYFINRHVTTGFHTFAQLLDTKYIPEVSIHDWDGRRPDAPAVNYFVNRHTTTGFHTFAQLYDTKYIPQISIYDWDGTRADAPSVDYFLNTNVRSGFDTFVELLDSKYVHGSSNYDWDGARADAPSTDFFINRNATGFTTFATLLSTEYDTDSSIYTWIGNDAPAVDYFINEFASGFHIRAQQLDSKYVPESSRYTWIGTRTDAPATDYFLNTNATGFTINAEKFSSEYLPETSFFTWVGARDSAPATDFFLNTYADGFKTFPQIGDSEYKPVSIYSWIGTRADAPSTDFFLNDNADGFSTFFDSRDTKFKPDTSRYTWVGSTTDAPSYDRFDDRFGHRGFAQFANKVNETQYVGADVDGQVYNYPDIPGYGRRLNPGLPARYNPSLLSLTDLANSFMPAIDDIVSDLVGFDLSGLTNTSILTAAQRYVPDVLGNKTGFVARSVIGVVADAVPDVKRVVDDNIAKLIQRNVDNANNQAILNGLLRRSTYSVPYNSSRYVVFSVKRQYASTFGNYSQETAFQGTSTMPLDGYNFRKELTSIGINLPVDLGSNSSLRIERMQAHYRTMFPTFVGPVGNGVVSTSGIHTIRPPFMETAESDRTPHDPDRVRQKSNILLQKLRDEQLMRYGFIDGKAYAAYFNHTFTTIRPNTNDMTGFASRMFENTTQLTDFDSELKKISEAFQNDNAVSINPFNSPNSDTPINTDAYKFLNRNPFDKKHTFDPDVGIHQGPARDSGVLVRRYKTLAYNELSRNASNFIGATSPNEVRISDFRKKLENPSEVIWSSDPNIIDFNGNNIHTNHGVPKAGTPGYDRRDPRKLKKNGSDVGATSADYIGDKIGVLDYRQNVANVTDMTEVYGDPKNRDLIDFFFSGPSLTDTDLLVFRAHLGSISDSASPSWNSVKMLGRADPVYIYDSFERSLSFTFKVVANTREELKFMWRKINALYSFTTPEYSPAGYMKGPLMRLTIGHLYRHLPGFIESFSVDIDNEQYTWETAKLKIQSELESDANTNGVLQVPHIVDISIGYKVIGNYRPEKNGKMFHLYNEDSSGEYDATGKVNWLDYTV